MDSPCNHIIPSRNPLGQRLRSLATLISSNAFYDHWFDERQRAFLLRCPVHPMKGREEEAVVCGMGEISRARLAQSSTLTWISWYRIVPAQLNLIADTSLEKVGDWSCYHWRTYSILCRGLQLSPRGNHQINIPASPSFCKSLSINLKGPNDSILFAANPIWHQNYPIVSTLFAKTIYPDECSSTEHMNLQVWLYSSLHYSSLLVLQYKLIENPISMNVH